MMLPCHQLSLVWIEHITQNEMTQFNTMTHDSDCVILVNSDVAEELRAVDGISNHLFLESLLVLFATSCQG
jgi:hypothetical protein